MRLVAFTFESEAEHLWKALERVLIPEEDPISWGQFIAKFSKEYFPLLVKNQREVAFMSLAQENRIVEDEAEFTKLSRYTSFYER